MALGKFLQKILQISIAPSWGKLRILFSSIYDYLRNFKCKSFLNWTNWEVSWNNHSIWTISAHSKPFFLPNRIESNRIELNWKNREKKKKEKFFIIRSKVHHIIWIEERYYFLIHSSWNQYCLCNIICCKCMFGKYIIKK